MNSGRDTEGRDETARIPALTGRGYPFPRPDTMSRAGHTVGQGPTSEGTTHPEIVVIVTQRLQLDSNYAHMRAS